MCDEISNRFYCGLKLDGQISEKEMKYSIYEYIKLANLEKLYHLLKFHMKLYNVPKRPVLSSCGTSTKIVSGFLDHYLKPIMQEGWSYNNDTEDFLQNV